MARVVWSARALDDVDRACEYIARDSLHYAHAFAQGVFALSERIAQQPFLGEVVQEYRRERIRERHFQSYRIIYRLGEEKIEIVAVIHAARLLPPEPPG